MRVVSTDADAARWITANAGLHDIVIGQRLTGGNANVTRLVTAREGRFVLRHPPANKVSDKAAGGIAREFAAISALGGQAPVARPIIFCEDPSIIGQPFSLTEFVDGVAITDSLPQNYSFGAVEDIGLSLMRTLGAIHRADPASLKERGFGRPEGFSERQIQRWLEIRAREKVRDLPLLEEIGNWLLENLPKASPPSIIHCDFHLDNCLSARDRPEVLAVIDWEMATLGDPLIDLGLCLFFWKRDPEANLGFDFIQAFSNTPEAPERSRLADEWSQSSGRDNSELPWYIVFSAWRLAAIVEGAYNLYVQGKVSDDYSRELEQNVPALLREAADLVEEVVR